MAAIVVATPAAARDRSAYFGLEAGGLFVTDTDVETNNQQLTGSFSIDHKMGIDGDMIAGYDFGMFRAEAELGYKRSEHKDYDTGTVSVDADGRSSVYSLMANAMIDVGQDEGISFYAAVALAMRRSFTTSTTERPANRCQPQAQGSRLRWQGIAGVRMVVSQYFESA